MHPLLWLMLHNYRNVLSRRLRTLRSPGRFLAFVLIIGGLLLLARQREAAEQLMDRNLRPAAAATTAGPTDAGTKRAATLGRPAKPPSPLLLAVGSLRENPEAVSLGMALLIAAFMAAAWLSPARENPLELTAAESATLLPAPLRRWEIVVYKVARWQIPLLFHSLALTLVLSGTKELDGSLRRALAFWILMATWRTQRGFVALVRATLESLRLAIVVRLVTLAGACLLVALLWANRAPEGEGDRALAVIAALPRLAESPLLRIVLWPVLALTKPIVQSGDTETWASALPPALGVLASMVGLVVLADAALQRASAGDRGRKEDIQRAAGTPFRLGATGHPAFALTYRQLAPFLRWSALSTPLGILLAVPFASWALPRLGLGDPSVLLSALIVSLTFFFVLPLAPLFVRLDVRREMERIDVLRGLPLPPGQVLAALGAAEWIACLALQGGAFVLFATNMLGRGTPIEDWWPWLARLLPFWPGFTLLGVCLCQIGALTFPTWVAPSNPHGPRIDAVGGRLLTLLGFGGALFGLLVPPAFAASFASSAAPNAHLVHPASVLGFYIALTAEVLLLHGWSVRSYEQLARHDPARGS